MCLIKWRIWDAWVICSVWTCNINCVCAGPKKSYIWFRKSCRYPKADFLSEGLLLQENEPFCTNLLNALCSCVVQRPVKTNEMKQGNACHVLSLIWNEHLVEIKHCVHEVLTGLPSVSLSRVILRRIKAHLCLSSVSLGDDLSLYPSSRFSHAKPVSRHAFLMGSFSNSYPISLGRQWAARVTVATWRCEGFS